MSSKTPARSTPPRETSARPPPPRARNASTPVAVPTMPPEIPPLDLPIATTPDSMALESDDAKKRGRAEKSSSPVMDPPSIVLQPDVLSPEPKRSKGDEDPDSPRSPSPSSPSASIGAANDDTEVPEDATLRRPLYLPPHVWIARNALKLQTQMRTALGDEDAIDSPDLSKFQMKKRAAPPAVLSPEPARKHPIRFDIRLWVQAGENLEDHYRLALLQFLSKIWAAEPEAVLYPWRENDRRLGVPALTSPAQLPQKWAELKQYIHRARLQMEGGHHWGQIYLGLNISAATLLEEVGHWFAATKQGLWPVQIQKAEDTTCLGWLLFSGPEYDKDALRQAIWNMVGVEVALRFRKIFHPSKPRDPTAGVKALHLEIDSKEPRSQRTAVEKLYSAHANFCPLGIQMRLVPETHELANHTAIAKAVCLREKQKAFLAQSETCLSWEISTLDLYDSALKTDLRTLIHLIPDPDRPGESLFHAVNKMSRRDGFIFRFNPAKSQTAREVVAGLLVFLGGLWHPILKAEKFHKFFTAEAVERSQEAWWDSTKKCVVTAADGELDNLIEEADTCFYDYQITVDLTELEDPPSKKRTAKPGYSGADSISTFHSTRTSRTNGSQTHQPKRGQKANVHQTPYGDAPSRVSFATTVDDQTTISIETSPRTGPPGGQKSGGRP